jgi:hypothetical protein
MKRFLGLFLSCCLIAFGASAQPYLPLMGVGSGGASSSGILSSFFGLNINNLVHASNFTTTYFGITPFPTAVGTGAIRMWNVPFDWNSLTRATTSPVKPAGRELYDFTNFDAEVAIAVSNNVKVEYQLGLTPSWSATQVYYAPANLGVTGSAPTTTSATASGTTSLTLTFAGGVPTGVVTGAIVRDVTSPSSIPAISLMNGSISGTTLTQSNLIRGPPPSSANPSVQCGGCTTGTTISSGSGPWTINNSQTVALNTSRPIAIGGATIVASQTSTTVTITFPVSTTTTVAGGDTISFNDDVADFATDLAEHVASISGAQALLIPGGENEPSTTAFWQDTTARLLMVQQSWTNAWKVINPSATMQSPAFNGGCGTSSVCQTYYGYGSGAIGTGQTAAQVTDIADFHFYVTGPPNTYPENAYLNDYGVPTVQTFLNAHGMSGKPLTATELGWGEMPWQYNTGFDRVAYIAREYLVLQNLGFSAVYHYAYDGGNEQEEWGTLWAGPNAGCYYGANYGIANGGTGYTSIGPNNAIYLALGSGSYCFNNQNITRLDINSQSGGVVQDSDTNVWYNRGWYSTPPTNPVATTNFTGASGLTVNVTWAGPVPPNGMLPEGVAYGQVYNWLVGATWGTCTEGSPQWTCTLTRAGGYQAEVIWNTDNSVTSVSVPSPYTQYHDLTGNVHTGVGSGTVTVTGQPILLENGNAGWAPVTPYCGATMTPPSGYNYTQLILEDQFCPSTSLNLLNWNPYMADPVVGGIWNNNDELTGLHSSIGNSTSTSPPSNYNAEFSTPYTAGGGTNDAGTQLVTGSSGLLERCANSSLFADYTWVCGYVSGWSKQATLPAAGGVMQFSMNMANTIAGGWPSIWFLNGGHCTQSGDTCEFDLQEGGYLDGAVPQNQVLATNFHSTGNSQVLTNAGVDLTAAFHTYIFECKQNVSVKAWIDTTLIYSSTTNPPTSCAYEAIISNTEMTSLGSSFHTVASGSAVTTMGVNDFQMYALSVPYTP